jgi:hypothetical protein
VWIAGDTAGLCFDVSMQRLRGDAVLGRGSQLQPISLRLHAEIVLVEK